jgi:3-methyladenine DNA glycosylase AlkD
MTPNALADRVRAELAAHAEPRFREGASRFFKESVDLWGVRSPDVHRIAAAAYRELKLWPAARRDQFAESLWKSGKIEEAGVAIYVYRRFHKQCAAREFRLFERWLDRYVTSWATCDGLASWLLAACVANDPSLIPRLRAWTRSRNRWKRRASIVALLQEAKQGRHTKEILDLAARLLVDPDDMVQKGVGWVLKETYPRRPQEVVAFLKPRVAGAPRLVLRIAAEKMKPRDRSSVRLGT